MLPQLPNFVSNRYTSRTPCPVAHGFATCRAVAQRGSFHIRLTFVTYRETHVARMARNMLCVLLRLHAARRCGDRGGRAGRGGLTRSAHLIARATRPAPHPGGTCHMAYRNTWCMQLSVLRLDSDTCSRIHALTARHRRSPRDRRASDDVDLSDSRLFR